MKRAAGVAGVAGVAGACHQKAEPRLFSDDELAAYETDLAVRLAANERPHCSPDLVAAIDGRALATATLEMLVASHTHGCSPFQIGVRSPPEPTQRALRALDQLEKRIVQLGATDPLHAVTLGGQTIASTASSAMARVSAKLDPIISKLTPAQAAAFGATLDQLIANVPPYADTLDGDREELESRPYRGVHFGDPRDEAGVPFALGKAWARADASECPRPATLARCAKRLEPHAPKPPRLDYKQLGSRLRHAEDPAALRAEIVAQLPRRTRCSAAPRCSGTRRVASRVG